MKLKYDLHIHSCLSPCGDNDMTPYNLTNMAKICGCDIIALTDHNTCLNCESAMKAGENIGLTVVPGMELCTSEEIHCICLFPELKNALSFSDYVKSTLPPIKNKEKIFGNQYIMNEADGILGSFDLLLTTASGISIESLDSLMKDYGGLWYPAHIDRNSYSVISALGDFPDSLETSVFELTYDADEKLYREKYPSTKEKILLRSSDSHYLENLMTEKMEIEPADNSIKGLFEVLR
ncbi:MAG: PHP domain-containing protein [Clostridia bacterium]|nr:PHP domain-containing protein [Clostridia bacterium]MBQ5904285.1 PHP domain-containing protein [Clostridia bacterium]